MSQNLGDLNLRIILETVSAEKNAQKFSINLKDVEAQSRKTNVESVRLSDKIQELGLRFQGVTAVLNILKSTFGEFIKSYQQQEVALAKLSNGLKNVGEGYSAFDKLSQQASNLQQITPFSDEEINNAQSMLTTFQKNSAEIEILTPRILDLAASYQKSGETGMDLQQVAVMLGKVNEETVGALRKVGVAFSEEQEEKLKSLKGTEQAIYLSEILDQNFKGMAETVGNTTAGKMAIFNNQVGELKESFGKLLVDILIPILIPIKELITYLNDAGPVAQRLALGITALSIAFVALNSSIGYLPYVLGGIITVLYSLMGGFKQTSQEIKAHNDAVLRATEVNENMKQVLGELNISANNMEEAYRGISDAIAFMSKTQLESAKLFIEAEKAKILALIETGKAFELQRLAEMDYVPPDRGESIEGRYKSLYGADLEKLDALLSQINSKLNFTFSSSPSTDKSGAKVKTKEIKEFIGSLAELENQLTEIQERIGRQSEGENIVSGLFGQEAELKEKIKKIKELNELGIKGYLLKRSVDDIAGLKKIEEKRFGSIFTDRPISLTPDETAEKENKTEKAFTSALSLAQQTANILGIGADTFAGKFLGALQEGLSLANTFANFLNIVFKIGSGGIFGLLGFAGGGQVPGAGSGDTVPAMLTPGEFVVRKSIVQKIGSGFFEWINGGGLFNSLAGRYAQGGMVAASGSGGVQVVVLESRVKGSDIVLSQARETRKTNRRIIP